MDKIEKKLNSILKDTAKLINPAAEELLSFQVDKETKKIVNYQILSGGKRIRPALSIISCRAFGGKVKDCLYPAASLEILHNYSLIIDDIIDHSQIRRGFSTCWKKFGQSIALCLAIDYSAALFEGAIRGKYPVEISQLLAKTVKKIVDGEILDILFEQSGREREPYIVENRYRKINLKDYFKMVGLKTASLFQASCEIGGICASAKEKEITALGKYGFNLGMAFQIQDDILDIFGTESVLGKKIGKDIIERKMGNIVILFAFEELSKKERDKILKILRKKEIRQSDIKEAVKLIAKTKSLKKSKKVGKNFVKKTKDALKDFPKGEYKNLLEIIADFVIEREK